MTIKTYMRDGAVTGIMVGTTMFSPVEQLETYIARLEADLTASLALVEAGRRECERLREMLRDHQEWIDAVVKAHPNSGMMRPLSFQRARAALAPEEPPE